MKNSNDPHNPFRYNERPHEREFSKEEGSAYGSGSDSHHHDSSHRRKRSRTGLVFLHVMELVTIGLSYLERSRIVRFITAKLGLDVVVEVTDRFGAPAGHRLSTFVSLLIAEPALIAVLVTAVWVLINLIVFLILGIRRSRRRKRSLEYSGNW